MAATRRKTNDVLASARRDLQAQLALVREEQSRLAAEEQVLTQALSSLDGGSASSSTATGNDASGETRTAESSTTRSTGNPGASRRRRRRASKSTADRVEELRRLLADGPKSRSDLATALKVSPARVQQLLGELGNSVASQPDPNQARGKLWTMKESHNGSSATQQAAKPRSTRAKAGATRRSPARRKSAAE